MEVDLLAKLIPNAVSAVAVIVVVWMFLRRQKEDHDTSKNERIEFIEAMKTIRDECHSLTTFNQKAFQQQIEQTTEKMEKLGTGYENSMRTFAGAIAANGEILQRMEEALTGDRRGQGRRHKDWKEEGGKS